MNAETPHDLFTAVQDQWATEVLPQAFTQPKLPYKQSCKLQLLVRDAWAKDAKAADERLHRVAMQGAKEPKTGSRGRVQPVAKPKTISPHIAASRARQDQVLRAFRNGPMTKRAVIELTGFSAVIVDNSIKRLIMAGKVARAGRDRFNANLFVYEATE